MSCPKNIKQGKFLWHKFTYEGKHQWQFSSLHTDAHNQVFYEHFYCPLCECTYDGDWMSKEWTIRKYGILPEFKWCMNSYWSLDLDDIEEQKRNKKAPHA